MQILGSTFQRRLLLIVLVVAGSTLGTSIWGVRDLASKDPVFLGETVARTLELVTFTLPLHLVERVPPSIRVAQWGVGATVVLVFSLLTLRLLRNPLLAFAAGRESGHAVVFGNSSGAVRAIHDLVRDRRHVIVLRSRGDTQPLLDHPKVLHIRGDPTQEHTLARVGVARAHAALVLGDDDTRQLAIGALIERHCEKMRPESFEPLRCVIEINDEGLRQSVGTLQSNVAGRRVERSFFFRKRTVARALLRRHPLDRFVDVGADSRVNVLIVNATGIAEQVLLEVLHSGLYDERGPRIVLLDHDASQTERVLRDRYPQIDAFCSLECREFDDSRSKATFLKLLQEFEERQFTGIYLCAGRYDRSLRSLAALDAASRELLMTLPPIYVYVQDDPLFLEHMKEQAVLSSAPMLVPFGDNDDIYSSGNLLEERLDTLARAIHSRYLEEVARQNFTAASAPAAVPWPQLAESYRDACRRQADHIEVKLRRVACASLEQKSANAFSFDSAEVEVLARFEHLRWMENRCLEGWTYGETRDDSRRRHPALAQYEDLGEHLKELDRSAVRSIPQLLARVERGIQRDFTVCVVGSTSAADADHRLVTVGREALDRACHEQHGRRLVLLSPIVDAASRHLVRDAVSRELAVLRVALGLPIQAVLGRLDHPSSLEFRRLLAESEQTFTMPITRKERAKLRAGKPIDGAEPTSRLANFLVDRSEQVIAIRDESGQGPEDLVAECLAEARRQAKPIIELVGSGSGDWGLL